MKKYSNKNAAAFGAILAAMFLPSENSLAAARREVALAAHVHTEHTRASNEPLEALLPKLRAAGIKAVMLSDHASADFEYKPIPAAGLFAVGKSFPSIMAAGPEKYLAGIARLEKKYPDMLIIPGAEAAADYWWSGSVFNGQVVLNDWHRHILVAGLEDPEDYRNLPIPGAARPAKFEPFLLWPIFSLALGFMIFRRRPGGGIALITLSAALLWGNYPFTVPARPVAGSSTEPYQKLIDYAASRGALTFWAHPEASNRASFSEKVKVVSRTDSYPEMLKKTSGYTGFAIFAEGYRKVGAPGGVWDAALAEYCDGKRNSPSWAISELDYGDGYNADMNILRNIVWLAPSPLRPTKKEVLAALAGGSFYALWRGKDWEMKISDFYVAGRPGSKAIFGGVVTAGKEILAQLDIESSDGSPRPVKITTVLDGAAARVIETTLPARIRQKIELGPSSAGKPRKKGYIRLWLDAGYPNMIATNPVFYVAGNE